MPRKKRSKQQQAKARSKAKTTGGGPRKQGLLGDLVDMGADTIKGIGRGFLPGLFKGTQMVTANNNVGIVAPRAMFKTSTQAQRLAEFDPERSIRITGNGLFGDRVVWPPGNQPSLGCFEPVPLVNPFPDWRGISPFSIDPRCFQLVSCYQFYAFRMIRFTYIPETSTGGVEKAEQSLVLAFSQDAQEYSDLPVPTAQQMLEQNISILNPIWSPCTITYEHDGTRVWRVNPSGEGTVDDMVQCLLGGRVTTRNLNVTDVWTTLGQLYVEYVLDCYEPQPVNDTGPTTVALPYATDGNGFVFGISYQGPGIFEYPEGYNTALPFPPNPEVPPPIFPPAPLLSLAAPRVKASPGFIRRPKQGSANPRALLARVQALEDLLSKSKDEEKVDLPGPLELKRSDGTEVVDGVDTATPLLLQRLVITPTGGEKSPNLS